MNKLYTTLLIACLAAGFTACNDDDCEDLHLGNLAHYPVSYTHLTLPTILLV